MPSEIEGLCKTLLEAKKDAEGKRKKAAKDLAYYLLDIQGFNALYSICCYPDMYAVEDGLLPVAGESLGRILRDRDLIEDPLKHYPFNPEYFNGFHPNALDAALQQLTEDQMDALCSYALAHAECSEGLTRYFYQVSSSKAEELCRKNKQKAVRHAKNAILLFSRLKKYENSFQFFMMDIVMHIIAETVRSTVVSLFMDLLKRFSSFPKSESAFEDYCRFHFFLLAKAACRDYVQVQKILANFRQWILQNRPQDECCMEVVDLVFKGDLPKANHALERMKNLIDDSAQEKAVSNFYLAWYIAARWIIQNRF